MAKPYIIDPLPMPDNSQKVKKCNKRFCFSYEVNNKNISKA